MSGLKNKFAYQLLATASQVLMPLVMYPYITRVLGADSLGKVNYIDFLTQAFMILASFGIPFYGIREVAAVRNDPQKRSNLIKELIIIQTITAMAACLLFVLVTFKHWEDQPILYMLALCNILINAFSYDWYVQGMEDFRFAAIRSVFVRIIMLVCFFMLVKYPGDYEIYYAIFSFGMLIIAGMNAAKMARENIFKTGIIDFKKHLKPLWHFFLTSSAISLYVNFDTIILHHITQNETEVGYYTTAVKADKIFVTVIIALSTVMISRMSFFAGEGNKESIKKGIEKYLGFIIIAGLPVCTGLYLLAPEITWLIAGGGFAPAVPLMRMLSFLPLIIAFSNMFCFQVLVPLKQEKNFLTAAIIGCIASIALNYLLIPSMRSKGAAVACLGTELIITVITGLMAYKAMQWKLDKKMLAQTVLATIIFVPVVIVCRKISATPWIIFATSFTACFVIYFLLQQMVFRNTVVKEIKEYVQNLIKRE